MIRIAGVLTLWLGLATPAAAIADPTAAEPSSCIDIAVEGSWIGHLDCLNADLRKLARDRQDRVASLYGAIAAGHDMAPAELGMFNQYAVQERLGQNFGKSAYPQRPPPATYSLPFGGGH